MPCSDPSRVDIVLVHSSDLHVDDETSATKHQDGTAGLAAVLAAAKAQGCDLLVKGAYTQSRLRQMIFGGATRHIIMESPIPVIMAPAAKLPRELTTTTRLWRHSSSGSVKWGAMARMDEIGIRPAPKKPLVRHGPG